MSSNSDWHLIQLKPYYNDFEYRHDPIKMRHIVERYNRNQPIPSNSYHNKGYKIHLNISVDKIDECLSLINHHIQLDLVFKEHLLSMKSTKRNDHKMDGVGRFVVYAMPNRDSAQFVLDKIIEIFGS
jgi:hypothetical protein